MKTREEMLAFIYDHLDQASDQQVEEYYWFFVCEGDADS